MFIAKEKSLSKTYDYEVTTSLPLEAEYSTEPFE